ncbi:MAG TPA: hypothetical protein VGD10_12730 [Allosphingosinicella sp.]|uniref:hypothetical protein n=1 Tax=Allosphingosinicella sp. TaxID=2823234 RepID=UPI002ED8240D
MRKIILSALALSTAFAAAPAAAQNWGGGYGYNRGHNVAVERQITQTHQRIEQMYQRRLLSNRERTSLHSQADGIQRRFYDYARNGLSQREHQDIQNRLQDLRQRIQRERREGREDRRDDRRDRWEDRRDRWDD